MKKFNEASLLSQAITIYLSSLIFSVALSPLAKILYLKLYNPDLIGGGFYMYSPNLEGLLGGFIFTYFIILSFLVFFLIKNKLLNIWLIGVSIPLLLAFINSWKMFFWAIILSLFGYLLARIILLAKKKLVKQ